MTFSVCSFEKKDNRVIVPESDENNDNEENFLLLSDIRPPFVESNPDKKEIRRGIFFF